MKDFIKENWDIMTPILCLDMLSRCLMFSSLSLAHCLLKARVLLTISLEILKK